MTYDVKALSYSSLKTRLNNVRKYMADISPKLARYAELEQEKKALLDELARR